MDPTKEKTKGEEEQRKNRIRITLTCQNLGSVEKGSIPSLISVLIVDV